MRRVYISAVSEKEPRKTPPEPMPGGNNAALSYRATFPTGHISACLQSGNADPNSAALGLQGDLTARLRGHTNLKSSRSLYATCRYFRPYRYSTP